MNAIEAKNPKTPISTGKLQAVPSLLSIQKSFSVTGSSRQPCDEIHPKTMIA